MDSAARVKHPMHNLRLVGPAGKRPTKKDAWLYPTFFWNQRKQRTGLVVTPSGKRFRLEDPADESSRRIPINAKECALITKEVILANADRFEAKHPNGRFPNLAGVHWSCNDPALVANQFGLLATERGPMLTERDRKGALDVPICVGDMVKLAVHTAKVYAMADIDVEIQEGPNPQDIARAREDYCETLRSTFAAEHYWAHVLKIEEEDGTDPEAMLLTVLPVAYLRQIPAAISQEPYEVPRRCVSAHHAMPKWAYAYHV